MFSLWQAFASLHILSEADISGPVAQLCVLALGYLLALVAIVSLPRLVDLDKTKNVFQLLGIDKKPRVIDILTSVPAYGVYIALTISFSFIVQLFWQGFQVDQVQEVGFRDIHISVEYIVAFIALVIIPPIAEEMLFRGYVFSRLRAKMGFVSTAIVTSLLFGVVHLQWNVGVDVFALSLVLCYLREYTGRIWAGVALHMIKNGVAFVLLFLYPDILQLLSR